MGKVINLTLIEMNFIHGGIRENAEMVKSQGRVNLNISFVGNIEKIWKVLIVMFPFIPRP